MSRRARVAVTTPRAELQQASGRVPRTAAPHRPAARHPEPRSCRVLDRKARVELTLSTAKNRTEAIQPLPEGTVAALRALKGSQVLPTAPLFRAGIPTTKALREDLAAAGIEYATADGVADLHALRVSYATSLARAGVPLAQAQQLMRHSDPKLTANVYTKLDIRDGRAAVGRIDPVPPKQADAGAAATA